MSTKKPRVLRICIGDRAGTFPTLCGRDNASNIYPLKEYFGLLSNPSVTLNCSYHCPVCLDALFHMEYLGIKTVAEYREKQYTTT
jgi:hypothetical protein